MRRKNVKKTDLITYMRFQFVERYFLLFTHQSYFDGGFANGHLHFTLYLAMFVCNDFDAQDA